MVEKRANVGNCLCIELHVLYIFLARSYTGWKWSGLRSGRCWHCLDGQELGLFTSDHGVHHRGIMENEVNTPMKAHNQRVMFDFIVWC
jgi:hypothetical protein